MGDPGAGAGGDGHREGGDSTAFAACATVLSCRGTSRAACHRIRSPCPDPDRIDIVGATEGDLAAVAELARDVWRKHYPGIITPEQIEYMLERGYSRAALRRFVDRGRRGARSRPCRRAPRRLRGLPPQPTAPARSSSTSSTCSTTFRAGASVSRLIAHVEAAARAQQRATLILNVNKNNVAGDRAPTSATASRARGGGRRHRRGLRDGRLRDGQAAWPR